VVAVKTVGVFLVSAFLIIPAATAQLLFRTFSGVTLFAVILGTAGAALGVFAAHRLHAPSGATIILTLGFVFFAVLLLRRGR
jgi:zinc transport system permease protein